MKLYIGGCFQGKREAVIKNENIKNIINAENADMEEMLSAEGIYGIDGFIRKNLDESLVNELADRFISENKNVVIINNEVGYGVVPIDKNERLFRELNGRFNIRIAQSSDEVYRVVSGICTRIK